jgi:serine/threonine protein kinase
MSPPSESSTTPDEEAGSSRPPIALPRDTRLRDEYRVEDVLGMGSFGITYRAIDEHLDTAVAIKEYYPRQIAGRTDATYGSDPSGSLTVEPHTEQDTEEFEAGLQQFMEEGRTIARFDHPNVVDVKSYFEEHGTGYLVMDYYEGQTLADHLAANGGRLSEEEAVGYLQDVLEGLVPVHDAGVLHRDIDPQNIYLVAEGSSTADGSDSGGSDQRAILIDFGAAREAIGQKSRSLDVILKPGYAPFEQYQPGGHHGPWTDVYACAATLYKCLTGLKPPEATERIDDDSLPDVREVRGEVSMETSLAVKKGLAVRPERRPESARAFAELLGRTRTADNQTQAPAGDAPQTQRPEPVPDEQSGTIEDAGTPASSASEAEPSTRTGTTPAGIGPEFEATTGPDADADGESTGSARSLVGLAAGIVVVVGGTLLVSDAGALKVLAFFGTWIAVCGGLIGLFRQGERLMTPEGRASISDWLLGEDFTDRPSNWPKTFTDLFDAVFTENHLSWTCFWRSALTSVSVIVLLILAFTGFGLIDLLSTSGTPAEAFGVAGGGILLILAYNTFIDYASLFETRWVLGKMSRTRWAPFRLGYLALDLVLTALCVILPVSLFQIFFSGVMEGYSVLSFDFWNRLFALLILMGDWFVSFRSSGGDQWLSIMLFSTLFTSVWVWLYVVSGLLIKAVQPILGALDWLKQLIDIESRPAEAMGFLLAVLVSIGFAVGAPFVL